MRGHRLVETYVEPGGVGDQRPPPRVPAHDRGGLVQARAVRRGDPPLVQRFFRDHFELEFYVRKLAKNGVNELAGDTAFTMDDLAVDATARLNRKVTYRDLPPAEYQAALLGMGLHQMIVDHNAG